MNNISIVKKAIKGNKDAFSLLMKQYKTELYKVAYIYTKNQEDALDAVNETVYKSYISINKLKKPEFFKTWLVRILINECINLLKKKNKLVLENNIATFNTPYNDIYDSKIEFDDLYKAINTLNENQKTALVLRYFEDLKVSEISNIMDLPKSTVKSHIRRAILSLKKLLGDDLYYEQ